jgi:hypothetical protein
LGKLNVDWRIILKWMLHKKAGGLEYTHLSLKENASVV